MNPRYVVIALLLVILVVQMVQSNRSTKLHRALVVRNQPSKEYYYAVSPCTSLGKIMHRLAFKLPKPLVKIENDTTTLVNVRIDVKDILPNPLAGIANNQKSSKPSIGEVLSLDIAVSKAKINAYAVHNVKFVKMVYDANDDRTTPKVENEKFQFANFECEVPISLICNLNINNIKLMNCALNPIEKKQLI